MNNWSRTIRFLTAVAWSAQLACAEAPSRASRDAGQQLDGARAADDDAAPSASDTSTSWQQRPLNEITFPSTHNSYNYGPVFKAPNVHQPVAEQLAAGIRGFELDTHLKDDEVLLFHNLNGALGQEPALPVLRDIRTFLDAHTEEVVILKFENYVPPDKLQAVVEKSGLMKYRYLHPKGAPPPTFEALLKANKRLIMASVPALLSSGLSLCETPFGRPDPASLWPPLENNNPCAGDFLSLVVYNTTDLGVGSVQEAKVINAPDFLLPLAERAWQINGKRPWRLIVDFPDIGDVYSVTSTLNGWRSVRGVVRDKLTGKPLTAVTWQNQFGKDSLQAVTWGRFSFPLRPDSTITLRPQVEGMVVVPSSVTVVDAGLDVEQFFEASAAR